MPDSSLRPLMQGFTVMKKLLRHAVFPIKRRLIHAACERLKNRSAEQPLKWLDIAYLALAWGNLGYAAGFSYLRHVGEHSIRTQGPILECGSGATTLLIGALTAKTDMRFIVLEHNREWYEYLKSLLAYLDFQHVELIHAPLTDYGDYRWYSSPLEPTPDEISLVICDGPPGSIRGGRYGLLPIMGERLASDCTILLDDTHRAAERRILDAWRQYRCMNANRMGTLGSYTEVICCGSAL